MTKFSKPSIPRIEELYVRNDRALKDLQLKSLTPLTVFLGPNGSGKSTIFDRVCISFRVLFRWIKEGMG